MAQSRWGSSMAAARGPTGCHWPCRLGHPGVSATLPGRSHPLARVDGGCENRNWRQKDKIKLPGKDLNLNTDYAGTMLFGERGKLCEESPAWLRSPGMSDKMMKRTIKHQICITYFLHHMECAKGFTLLH